MISDANGAAIFRTNYKPFGLLWSPTGTGASKFNYTGELQDPRSGLYLLHARYYDPETGRFFQADPLPGTPRRPQSLNQYAYVTNNPLRYVDPTGQRMTGSVSEREERKGSFWGGIADFFEDNWKTIVVVAAAAASASAVLGLFWLRRGRSQTPPP